MSIHSSLRGSKSLVGERSVFTRIERLAALKKTGKFDEWQIDINEEGALRCSCPSFIYCPAPKTCKHVRKTEATVAMEQQTLRANQPEVLVKTEALRIFEAMCVAATKATTLNARLVLGPKNTQAMVDTLAAKLAVWAPKLAPTPAPVRSGVRHITFDDE